MSIEMFDAYAVQVRRDDGTTFLACNGEIGPKLFRKRATALAYADELAEHIGPRRRLKIVRVVAQVSTHENARLRADLAHMASQTCDPESCASYAVKNAELRELREENAELKDRLKRAQASDLEAMRSELSGYRLQIIEQRECINAMERNARGWPARLAAAEKVVEAAKAVSASWESQGDVGVVLFANLSAALAEYDATKAEPKTKGETG